MQKCPFKPGDLVIYKPSLRGYNLTDGVRLIIGKQYRIKRIEKDNYLIVEEYDHPGGGLYWTEFESIPDFDTKK